MTDSIKGLPVSHLKSIGEQLRPVDLRERPALLKSFLDMATSYLDNGRTPAERQDAHDRQLSMKVHSVFRRNGEIIAVHYRGGGTFMRNAAVGASPQNHASMSPEAVVRHMTDVLSRRFGGALDVTTYPEADAPTYETVMTEINGRPPHQTAPPDDSRLRDYFMRQQEQLTALYEDVLADGRLTDGGDGDKERD